MSQLPAGVQAPDFELKARDGQVFQLAEAIAKGPVVLVFYKASCPTCQFTFPYLERIHEERGSEVRIIGISQDEPQETDEFMKRFGIQFETVIDDHPYDVSMAYGIENVPATFVIGADGKIQLSDYGFSKAALSTIAQPLELFRNDDGVPATRPG
jgi:peroxiredoxin